MKHQGQAPAAMPQIRVLCHAVEGFLRLRPDELEPRALAHAAERLRRQQRDVVASLAGGAPRGESLAGSLPIPRSIPALPI